MVSVTIPRAIAAGAVIAAVLLVLLARAPSDEASSRLSRVHCRRHARNPWRSPWRNSGAPRQTLAAAKQRELEAMSETFRNTTFLIAIRDAGFVCDELLRVFGGLDDSAKWMASCSEMHAYTVAVASDGTLHVAPTLAVLRRQWPQPTDPSGELGCRSRCRRSRCRRRR